MRLIQTVTILSYLSYDLWVVCDFVFSRTQFRLVFDFTLFVNCH